MRILVLAPESPFPPRTGGQSRTFYMLKALSTLHEVTLLTFDQDDSGSSQPSLPIRMQTVPWEWPPLYREMYEGDSARSAAATEQLTHGTDEPWFVSCYDSPAMETALRRMLGQSYDLLWIEHTFMARFRKHAAVDLPVILDLHNVHALMASREAEQLQESALRDKALQEARRTREFEASVCRASDVCITCSERETQALRELLAIEHVETIPNGVNCDYFQPALNAPTTADLVFTGMLNYAPNVQGLLFFCRAILPLIKEQFPGVHLRIVGANPCPEVRALEDHSVSVHANVPDVRPYLHTASVAVVPLLHGGGTRLKILDAAACGKAIVSTSLGAEGLSFVPGGEVEIADAPPAFAAAVIDLLNNHERRAQLGLAARAFALRYDWRHMSERVLSLVNRVGNTPA